MIHLRIPQLIKYTTWIIFLLSLLLNAKCANFGSTKRPYFHTSSSLNHLVTVAISSWLWNTAGVVIFVLSFLGLTGSWSICIYLLIWMTWCRRRRYTICTCCKEGHAFCVSCDTSASKYLVTKIITVRWVFFILFKLEINLWWRYDIMQMGQR